MKQIEETNIIPDFLIDIFYKRIEYYIEKGSKQVSAELERIKSLNADKIPNRISKLLYEHKYNENV